MTEITHRTVESNGIEMHLAEAGQGPLVVLCHGFPESWYSWRHQLVALAEAGYHAVAPDQRGYGRTTAPREIEAYTQFDLVGDIVGLVAALGEETAVVAGHDWGAPVAWNCALMRPDLFRAVIALSVPTSDRGPVPVTTALKEMFGDNFFYILYFQTPGVAEHELRKNVRLTMRKFLFAASGDAGEREMQMHPKTIGFLDLMEDPAELPPWLTEADLDFFVAEFERTGFRGGLNWYRNFERTWQYSAPFQGAKITPPALFISGDRDLIRMNPTWEQGLRGVCTDLRDPVILPGIGHWTQQEAPAAVNEAMIGFLDSLA